ncbi:MAG: PfkB family carbohydrate kinase [Chitinophagaceae bacterium]
MYDICSVGHITLDKVITPHLVKHMPGGTSYYFSNAIRSMPLSYLLVTSVGSSEMDTVNRLRSLGIEINTAQSAHSVYFVNIYSNNQEQRIQKVLRKADPFLTEQLKDVYARIFHLGPLLADDMSAAFIKNLAERGRVSLDVQGFLRKVENNNIVLTDWPEKNEVLKYIDFLKADDREMQILTGYTDARAGALLLSEWGVKEVIITFGNKGSLIYTGGVFYDIPAFVPHHVSDETGCGDTYMAAYLSQRLPGKEPQDAGEFAAAMAALKTETYGPFTGTPEDVFAFMSRQKNTGIDITVLSQA